MRVMFVITRGDSIGGAQVHVRDLATALLGRGDEVRVVTGRRGILSDELAAAGVSVVECAPLQRSIHPLKDATAVAAVRGLVRAYAPDLVSTHSSKAGIVGRLACALGGPPCLFTAHGWAFAEGVPERRRRLYRRLELMLAPLAARIICVSEHDRQLGLAAGIDAHRLVTIHNGMPDAPTASRAEPGLGKPLAVVMIARFDQQKDHETLLRAVANVPAARLSLIGDGPNLPAMQALAAELGLGTRVDFLGQRRDVAEVLRTAQVFALISRWEGFPRSTLEAMRAGLPCVVTAAGGSAEAIDEGVTGYVIERGDVAALADRLARLAADAGLRAKLGAAGRHRYEREFTFAHMFDRTLDVYRSAAGGAS